MKLWAITGRIPGDDDDSLLLVSADDQLEAESKFVHHLGDERYEDEAEIAEMVKVHGVSVYLGEVVLIGTLSHAGALVSLDPATETLIIY